MVKLKDFQDTDAQYNPHEMRQREQQAAFDREFKDIADNINDTADSSAEDAAIDKAKNIDNVKQQEGDFNYPGKTEAPQKRRTKITGFLKKNGASASLVGLLLGALGGITMLISPGLAVVQMKEILTDDLNDQLSAMDLRTTHVFKAKLRDMGTGICGPKAIKVKCGFKGMSDRQVRKFQKAGFTVEKDGKTTFGFNKVKSLSLTDSAGNTITMNNPREMNRLLGDRIVRNAVRKAFNPKFAGFFDAKSTKVYGIFNTNTRDKIGAGTDADKDNAVNGAVEGDPIGVEANQVASNDADGDGKDDNADDNKAAQETSDRVNSGDGVSTQSMFASVAKNGAKSTIKGLMVTGALDSACSVMTAARAVEAGAKVYRNRQLIRFAMVYLTAADMVKAGTMTPDIAEYVGNKLTATDTAQKVVNENSKFLDTEGSGKVEEVDNPDYGKNAFDSKGYKTAMYNEAPTLSARDLQYTVGGGALMGTLSKLNDVIRSKNIGPTTCKVVQNWFFRGASLIAGAALGLISFGTSLYVSIGASIAIGMAIPLLENYLKQMIAGTVVDGSTKGVDAGNAIFSGTGGLMGAMAMSRGMKPANKSDLKKYLSLTEEVNNEYIAMETEEARKTPFDVMNRYSFLGSLARTLLPIRTTSSISLGNNFVNTLGALPSIMSSFTPGASAMSDYNEERFSKCKDYGYEELNIDADIFCNVRYVMSPYELGLDSDEVRGWMYDEGYVSENGESQGDYADWLSECTERQIGWGVDDDQDDIGDGKDCMKTDKKSSYFRVYTMDDSIIEAMEYVPTENITPEGDIGTLTVGSYNVRTSTLNNADFGDPDRVYDKEDQLRMEGIAENIEQKGMLIVGTQEVRTRERQGLMGALENYGATKLAGGKHEMSDVIFYDKRSFKEVDFGTYAIPKQGTKLRDAVWAKLQTESGASVYVFNMHASLDASEQQKAAENTLAEIERVVGSSGDPVIVMGDMNSNDVPPENKVKLTFEASGILKYTRDATTNRKGYNCDTISSPGDGKQDCRREGSRGSHRDQMWVTKSDDIVVNSWENMATPENLKLSDHNPIIVTMDIPGISTTTSSDDSALDVTVAAYNMCHEIIHTDCPKKATKATIIANNISGKGGLGDEPFDIIAGNEVTKATRSGILSKLPNYDAFPKQNNWPEMNGDGVFWNTDEFTFVKGDYLNDVYGNGSSQDVDNTRQPWVELKSKSGRSVFVLSIHGPPGSDKPANAEKRQANAAKYLEWATRYAIDDNLVIVAGDFNSRGKTDANGGKSSYCIMTATKVMAHAIDLNEGGKGECPSENPNQVVIDQVYASRNIPEITASKWRHFNGSNAVSATDHGPSWSTIKIPGSTGEITWPVDKKYWLADRADFLGPHTANSGTFTGVGDSLAADIGSPPDGSSVYAMVGGRVTGASLGGHGLIISTPIQGGVLEVAYAHGPRTGLETEYKAGDPIMRIGCIGNCEGGHLHIDMAFNGKGVCPQDVFLALDKGQTPDFAALTRKAAAPCGRS